jgi:hypothetical protein
MRLVFTIIILAVLAEPASAAPSPPLSGRQLIKLCSTDILRETHRAHRQNRH